MHDWASGDGSEATGPRGGSLLRLITRTCWREKGHGMGGVAFDTALKLSYTRCSVWKGGWYERHRRKVVAFVFFESGAREEGMQTATSGLPYSALGQTRGPRWSEIPSKPWDGVACEWVTVAAVSTGVTEGSGIRFLRLRLFLTIWRREAPVVVFWLAAIQTR